MFSVLRIFADLSSPHLVLLSGVRDALIDNEFGSQCIPLRAPYLPRKVHGWQLNEARCGALEPFLKHQGSFHCARSCVTDNRLSTRRDNTPWRYLLISRTRPQPAIADIESIEFRYPAARGGGDIKLSRDGTRYVSSRAASTAAACGAIAPPSLDMRLT